MHGKLVWYNTATTLLLTDLLKFCIPKETQQGLSYKQLKAWVSMYRLERYNLFVVVQGIRKVEEGGRV